MDGGRHTAKNERNEHDGLMDLEEFNNDDFSSLSGSGRKTKIWRGDVTDKCQLLDLDCSVSLRDSRMKQRFCKKKS